MKLKIYKKICHIYFKNWQYKAKVKEIHHKSRKESDKWPMVQAGELIWNLVLCLFMFIDFNNSNYNTYSGLILYLHSIMPLKIKEEI